MELIVISESKLKIMLSGQDMRKYELEENTVDCADAHTREVFRHIFEDARAEIGFNTEGERLFIQLYASKGGGCEIFVTKLGESVFPPAPSGAGDTPDGVGDAHEEDGEGEAATLLAVDSSRLSEGERELLRRVYACGEEGEMALSGGHRRFFCFSCLGDLLAVCRRLQVAGFGGESQAYIVEGAREVWYLCLDKLCGGTSRIPRRFGFLAEYGREARGEDMGLYLSEYGRLICGEDAVGTLASLA